MSSAPDRTGGIPPLAPLEVEVMRILWKHGSCTAGQVLERRTRRPKLTDSSIRTVLRRLEAKRMVTHDKVGKRYVFRALVAQHEVAAAAARRIIDTVCGGAVESLLIGLIENETISAAEIESIRARIEEAGGDE